MSNEDRAQVAALGAVPLTNDMTLIRVPKRHARRAELAVVLAELAEALGLDEKEGPHALDTWDIGDGWALKSDGCGCCRENRLVIPFTIEEWMRDCYDDEEVAEWIELGREVTDPLEAARLALAHVRGRG